MPGEDIQSWSVTAVNNGNADSSIEWREGQTRRSVNDSSRSEMAAHAKDRNLKNGSIVTGGSANAQTFTSGVSYIAPIPTGLIVKLKIGAGLTNTGPATLNMDGIGDTVIKDDTGDNIRGGELVGGCYADFLFNGTNWVFLYSREFLQNLIEGGTGIILSLQVFETPGNFTYTPTPGMACCLIDCVGGGGGGGGVYGAELISVVAGGGGSGGWSRKLATAAQIGVSHPVIVGNGGANGDGLTFGSPGGGSSVGSLCGANGGGGGQFGNADTVSGNPGGAGAAPGTGDITAGGNAGSPGHWFSGLDVAYNTAADGGGGASVFGGGSLGLAAGNGNAGGRYGAGGAGAGSENGSEPANGGFGSAGVVIIMEFAGRGAPGQKGIDGQPGAAGPIGPPGPAGAGTGDVLVSGTPAAGQFAQWVDTSHIAGVAAPTGLTTGDVKLTFKTTADVGWVLMNDGSIGNAASGATARADADTSPLFMLLWNNVAALGLQNSAGTPVARGASAAADFAVNHRLLLPAVLGRALAGAGAGAGLTARSLSETLGEEAHALSVTEMPSHTHTVNDPTHAHGGGEGMLFIMSDGGVSTAAAGGDLGIYNTSGVDPYTAAQITSISIQPAGSGGTHNTMQPTTFLNVMIKL